MASIKLSFFSGKHKSEIMWCGFFFHGFSLIILNETPLVRKSLACWSGKAHLIYVGRQRTPGYCWQACECCLKQTRSVVITFFHAASDALIPLAFIGRARRHPRFSGRNSEEYGYLPDMKEGNNEIQVSKKPARSTLGE